MIGKMPNKPINIHIGRWGIEGYSKYNSTIHMTITPMQHRLIDNAINKGKKVNIVIS